MAEKKKLIPVTTESIISNATTFSYRTYYSDTSYICNLNTPDLSVSYVEAALTGIGTVTFTREGTVANVATDIIEWTKDGGVTWNIADTIVGEDYRTFLKSSTYIKTAATFFRIGVTQVQASSSFAVETTQPPGASIITSNADHLADYTTTELAAFTGQSFAEIITVVTANHGTLTKTHQFAYTGNAGDIPDANHLGQTTVVDIVIINPIQVRRTITYSNNCPSNVVQYTVQEDSANIANTIYLIPHQ